MTGLRVSVFLAGRSLARSSYGIAAATTVMMLLIYVSLLFLPSLIQGAINRVNAQLVDTLTSNIVITPSARSTSIDHVSAYLNKIRHTRGVSQATAVYHVGTQVSHGDDSGSWTVDAINPGSYAKVFTTPSNLLEGRYLTKTDTTQVLLGIGVAGAGQTDIRGYRASLKTVHAHDTVKVTLVDGQTVKLTVAGVYDNQFPLSDNNAYFTRKEANSLLPATKDEATTIFVRTTRGADVNQVVSRLRGIRQQEKFETSADLGATVADQVASFRLISDILKVISLLMAAVTIFTVTFIDLVTRRRQIGIERAIGIRAGPIVTSYIIKALTYALVGITAGFLLFRYLATPIVADHPFHFPNGPVVLATTAGEMTRDLAVLLVVAALAAVLPAVRAVRLRILDAIWGT